MEKCYIYVIFLLISKVYLVENLVYGGVYLIDLEFVFIDDFDNGDWIVNLDFVLDWD